MPRTKKVRKMMESFPELREKGMQIPEIADKYNVNVTTVYKLLNVIAQQHNMRKEDLLEFPQKSHEGPRESKIKVLSKNSKNIERYSNVMISLDDLENQIKNCLELIERRVSGGKKYDNEN